MGPARRSIGLLTALIVALGCHPAPPATPATSAAGERVAQYDPARDLGPLFHDVQMARVFGDSKTFVDATPRAAPSEIVARYLAGRGDGGFDLRAFIDRNFIAAVSPTPSAAGQPAPSMSAHLTALWQTLVRPPDRHAAWSSLIPLPFPYVVPGGRFREIYYWDSYFTMLGLVESGRLDLVEDMLDNFAYLVETTGHVPNGNRTYYLSRSQPPFFGAMIALFADRAGTAKALQYLDALEKEHAFWMDGAPTLAPLQAYRRVVRLADGSVLNRYWDDRPEPRPESYREDVATAMRVPPADRTALYRNIRATAESGWDFSSRWMRDPRDLTTLETTDLVPVDLNSLLVETERTIARLRSARRQPGDREVAQQFEDAADRRRRALVAASYDAAEGFFFDVRWRTGARVVDRPTMASAVPLFFGLASLEQGRAVAARLERDFLDPGGFVTTTIASGQQWDAPNGWPPLEWMGIEGVRRYDRNDLAADAGARWLALNERTYQSTGKMMEKYDVRDLQRAAGGGEYPAQDGFGWTNGVALALEAGKRRQAAATAALVATPGRQTGVDVSVTPVDHPSAPLTLNPTGRHMDLTNVTQQTISTLTFVAWKVIGALALWLLGRWLISLALRLLGRALARQNFDQTLVRYMQTGVRALLNVVLIVALLGYFGVETTSFAALLAAGGVAIGVAWGGLLANFAAGAFLVFLRPFKVGDFVTAGGVTGTVDTISLFGTTINTPDNVLTIVGNNKIFSDTIQNYSANPYRRVDLTATISNAVDPRDAIRLLKDRIASIPNVRTTPGPDIDVLQFTPAGPVLCVRPYCSNNDYWQVYFDTNRTIRETFDAAGFPTPAPTYALAGRPAEMSGR